MAAVPPETENQLNQLKGVLKYSTWVDVRIYSPLTCCFGVERFKCEHPCSAQWAVWAGWDRLCLFCRAKTPTGRLNGSVIVPDSAASVRRALNENQMWLWGCLGPWNRCWEQKTHTERGSASRRCTAFRNSSTTIRRVLWSGLLLAVRERAELELLPEWKEIRNFDAAKQTVRED